MLPAAFVDDWRRFAQPRFRIYHYLALSQGVVAVLAGFDVVIPLALALGSPPPVALLLGVLPVSAGMAQLFVPRLLARTDGNLRGLTILIATVSEPRGLWFAAIALLCGSGLIGAGLALLLLAALVAIGSVFSSIVTANLLSWHSAVLDEQERRLVVPRLLAVSLAIGAMLLMPIAVLLDGLSQAIGVSAYALPLVISGVLGVIQVAVLRRMRHPGRVIVPPAAEAAPSGSPRDFDRFLRVTTLNALGMGFTPALSVYAISVLGLSAGFWMLVASISTLTMVVAAAIAGSRLVRGSSGDMLRTSFAVRSLAMLTAVAAIPGTVTAPALVVLSAMLGSIGFAHGSLAANERLFRLIKGPAVIRQHARYLARTSGAMTIGQVAGAALVAFGYPAYVALYLASAGARVLAYREARAAPTPATSEQQPDLEPALAPAANTP